MSDQTPIQGELQAQVMAALWRLGSGNVDQVRDALPARYRSAYTTVQTVLNRLAERGLLDRVRHGRSFTYEPRVSEAQYLSGSISRALASVSADARRAGLAQVLASLGEDELSEVQKLSRRVAKSRKGGGS